MTSLGALGSRLEERLKSRSATVGKGSRILALGVAYKAGVGDIRDSPALEIIEDLLARGAQLEYADPRVPQIQVGGHLLKSVAWAQADLSAYDLVVLLTAHPEFERAARAGHPQRHRRAGRLPSRHQDLRPREPPDRRARLAPPAAVGEEPLRLRRPHLLAEPVQPARLAGAGRVPDLLRALRRHLRLQRRGRRREGPAASREALPAHRAGRPVDSRRAGAGHRAAGGQPHRRLLACPWASGSWPPPTPRSSPPTRCGSSTW